MSDLEAIKAYDELKEKGVLTRPDREAQARELIQRATEAGIPIAQQEELVAMLMDVSLPTGIPDKAFRTAAEIVAWIKTIRGS